MKKILLMLIAMFVAVACSIPESPTEVIVSAEINCPPGPPPIVTDTMATGFNAACPYRVVEGVDTTLIIPGRF